MLLRSFSTFPRGGGGHKVKRRCLTLTHSKFLLPLSRVTTFRGLFSGNREVPGYLDPLLLFPKFLLSWFSFTPFHEVSSDDSFSGDLPSSSHSLIYTSTRTDHHHPSPLLKNWRWGTSLDVTRPTRGSDILFGKGGYFEVRFGT